MRKLDEIGICPSCGCSISIFKTNNYKRFAKCEECGMSYALPKRGSISNSALLCPKSGFPILIVEKKTRKHISGLTNRALVVLNLINVKGPKNYCPNLKN